MWDLNEAVRYYRDQGAPGDQSVLISLLREIQQENGGCIPMSVLPQVAGGLDVKENFLLAVVKRIPSLRLDEKPVLELCAGPNCCKHADLTEFVEKTYGMGSEKLTIKYVPCMRLCGKGPNIKWNGKVFHRADAALLRSLIEKI